MDIPHGVSPVVKKDTERPVQHFQAGTSGGDFKFPIFLQTVQQIESTLGGSGFMSVNLRLLGDPKFEQVIERERSDLELKEIAKFLKRPLPEVPNLSLEEKTQFEENHLLYYKSPTEKFLGSASVRDSREFAFFKLLSVSVIPQGVLARHPVLSEIEFKEATAKLSQLIEYFCRIVVMFDDVLDKFPDSLEQSYFVQELLQELQESWSKFSDNPGIITNNKVSSDKKESYFLANLKWPAIIFQGMKDFPGLHEKDVNIFLNKSFQEFLRSCLYGDMLGRKFFKANTLSDFPSFDRYLNATAASMSTPVMIAMGSACVDPKFVEPLKRIASYVAQLGRIANDMSGLRREFREGNANGIILHALHARQIELPELQIMLNYLQTSRKEEDNSELIDKYIQRFMYVGSPTVNTIMKKLEYTLVEMNQFIKSLPTDLQAESFLSGILHFTAQYINLSCSEWEKEIWLETMNPVLSEEFRKYPAVKKLKDQT